MTTTAPPAPAPYTRANPFKARLIENRLLSGPASAKDTRHLVLSLSESGLTYHPGDSLGVLPRNPPGMIDELLERLALDSATLVVQPGGPVALRELLINNYILNRVSKKFVGAVLLKLPEGSKKQELTDITADETRFSDYTYARDFIDVLIDYPVCFSVEELLVLANKMAPRLYSIASSPRAHPGEVHLTVAVVKYHSHGREKQGLASGFLGYGQGLNVAEVPVYVQPTRHFHLPPPDAQMIMVGPGTGIAPFRAFLEERAATGATGANWLFFGDQTRAGDFLYADELLAYQQKGLLTRLDLAFSRDQTEKIYVQDRMRENGAELWQWLKAGAYFYVCGDAKRMAKDVHATLINIAQEHGGFSPEAAKEFIEVTLTKTEKRYLKDVY